MVKNTVGINYRTCNIIGNGLYHYQVCKDIGLAYGNGRSLALSLSDMWMHDLISSVRSEIRLTVKIWSQITIGGSANPSAQWKGLETQNRCVYSCKSIKFEICYIYDWERVSCVIHIFLLKWFHAKTYVNTLILHIGAKGAMNIHIYTYDRGRTDGQLR